MLGMHSWRQTVCRYAEKLLKLTTRIDGTGPGLRHIDLEDNRSDRVSKPLVSEGEAHMSAAMGQGGVVYLSDSRSQQRKAKAAKVDSLQTEYRQSLR